MDTDIPEHKWLPVDEMIFAGPNLQALIAIRALREPPLPFTAMLDLMHERYRKLRVEQPERFALDEKTYWDGCYS